MFPQDKGISFFPSNKADANIFVIKSPFLLIMIYEWKNSGRDQKIASKI